LVREWSLPDRSYYELATINVLLLLLYALADYSAWTRVSTLPGITYLYWTPLGISLHSYEGLWSGPNIGFEYLVAMIAANLTLIRKSGSKISLVNLVLVVWGVFTNAYEWGLATPYLPHFASEGPQWSFLSIEIYYGISPSTEGILIFPNLAPLVVLALGVMNTLYARWMWSTSSSDRRYDRKK
jgi:hypothetical protein